MNKIIAIVGMCGSGKSVATDLLVELGYEKIYFGGVVLEKIKEMGLSITPQNEKMVKEDLRKQYGMAAMAVALLPRIKELSMSNNIVLDGVYSWDELKLLKEEFKDQIKVIAIVVDKEIRYSRLMTREVRPFTNEEAINRDISEIENIAKAGPIAYTDYYIDNNGTIDDYKKRLLQILDKIGD